MPAPPFQSSVVVAQYAAPVRDLCTNSADSASRRYLCPILPGGFSKLKADNCELLRPKESINIPGSFPETEN